MAYYQGPIDLVEDVKRLVSQYVRTHINALAQPRFADAQHLDLAPFRPQSALFSVKRMVYGCHRVSVL
jgi:hypothetical protein